MSDNDKKTTVELPSDLIYEVLTFSAREQRAQRRYRFFGYVMKLVFSVLVLFLIYHLGDRAVSEDGEKQLEPHIASVSIYGAIAANGPTDADKLIPVIRKAFENGQSRAVILRVNSPGGSPVQADRIYSEIMQLKKEHPNKKVYAVVEDLCASAAYYISSSADEIIVNKNSLVGSIGVISTSFGFQELMGKLGVERRVLTAGTNKAMMDPYTPLRPEIKEYWLSMLAEVHGYFIESVKKGRGDRLKTDNKDLFTGLVWTGAASIKLGLSDREGSALDVSREVLDGKINIVDYTPMPNLLKQFGLSASASFGQSIGQGVAEAIQTQPNPIQLQ